MSGYDDMKGIEEFDEISQMQLDEFCGSLAGATQSEITVCIIDTGNAVQVAVKTQSEDPKAVAKMKSIQMMCAVAGGALFNATKGQFNLMIQEPDGSLHPVSDNVNTTMGERPHG
jgi:hypothetical protein